MSLVVSAGKIQPLPSVIEFVTGGKRGKNAIVTKGGKAVLQLSSAGKCP